MDGNGSLFGTLQGNTREVLAKFTVDLPKKHGRGGQSALRFARLRMEKRHNYVRKVAETAVEMFIKNDKVVVAGLVLAGSADFKTELGQSDMFDQRLQVLLSFLINLYSLNYRQKSSKQSTFRTVARMDSTRQLSWPPIHCKTSNSFRRKSSSLPSLPKSLRIRVNMFTAC